MLGVASHIWVLSIDILASLYEQSKVFILFHLEKVFLAHGLPPPKLKSPRPCARKNHKALSKWVF
jgi:hypothetical protein